MAEETEKKDLGPKKRLSKPQAIGVMIVGGILMVLAWVVPAEQGTTPHLIKVAIGLVGFVGLCLGAYFRP